MHVCLLDGFRNTNLGREVEALLADLEEVKYSKFEQATNLNLDGWLTECPFNECGHRLTIVQVKEGSHEYAAYCGHCGWTAANRWVVDSNYITLPELAERSGVNYRTIVNRVANGTLAAADFGVGGKAKWRVNKQIASEFIAAKGNPRWAALWS